MSNKTITYLSITVIAIGLIFLANGLILAWTEPSSAPPEGNVPAPLNVGSTGQSKAGGLILNTGGASVGLIVDQGNVGIGTTNPTFPLHVSGSDSNIIGIIIENTYGSGRPWELNSKAVDGSFRVTAGGPGGGLRFLITPGGNVGIGTTDPQAKLHIAGTAGVDGIMFPDNTLQTTAAGGAGQAGASSYIAYGQSSPNCESGWTKAYGGWALTLVNMAPNSDKSLGSTICAYLTDPPLNVFDRDIVETSWNTQGIKRVESELRCAVCVKGPYIIYGPSLPSPICASGWTKAYDGWALTLVNRLGDRGLANTICSQLNNPPIPGFSNTNVETRWSSHGIKGIESELRCAICLK